MNDAFDQFWSAYPKKRAKAKARVAFDKAMKKTDIASVLHALSWQVLQEDWLREDGRYVPNPTTYLNGEMWDDEPLPHSPSPNFSDKNLRTMKAIYEDDDDDDI